MNKDAITGDSDAIQRVRTFVNGFIDLESPECPACGGDMSEERRLWNGMYVDVNECECGHRELADDTIHDPRMKPK